MSRKGRTYALLRWGLNAARSDAKLYGVPVHDGNDSPAWYDRPSSFDGGDDFIRAYHREFVKARNRRFINASRDERVAAVAVAERNRELRNSSDPARLRATWKLNTELADLKTRVAVLEKAASKANESAHKDDLGEFVGAAASDAAVSSAPDGSQPQPLTGD